MNLTERKAAFVLPEGNVQIAFSGGRTSARMLHDIVQANQPWPVDRVKVIFTNTGKEREEALRFVQECGLRWGVPIIWLEYDLNWSGAAHRPKEKIFDTKAHSFREVSFETASRRGEPFEKVIEYFGFLPNRVADFCSHNLKTRTARRYCVASGWKNWTTAIGMRADEPNRILKKQPKERYKVWYPLNEAGLIKDNISAFWDSQSFDLQLANTNGVTPSGNCDGCFKKSEQKRADMARHEPDRVSWWAELERKYGGSFASGSWDELSEWLVVHGDWAFKTNDVLCQVDDGECAPW
jgi:3'-phosphoadenosine 5'-phosphosulfate sulfotransferase (PAPS reductase)/FAD synthetase